MFKSKLDIVSLGIDFTCLIIIIVLIIFAMVDMYRGVEHYPIIWYLGVVLACLIWCGRVFFINLKKFKELKK